MQNVTGKRIRQLRRSREQKMTQADMARGLQLKGVNIDRAGVAKIEGGYRQVSDVELVVIAEVLGVPPAILLESPSGENDQAGRE